MKTFTQNAARLIYLSTLVVALCACGQANTENMAETSMNTPVQPTGDPNAPVDSRSPQQPSAASAPSRSGAQGTISDSAGQPLAGVLVIPQSTANPPLALPEIALMTDAQGRYQWQLAPGPYTLTFTHDGYAPATQPIVVQAGQPTTLDLTLQKQ